MNKDVKINSGEFKLFVNLLLNPNSVKVYQNNDFVLIMQDGKEPVTVDLNSYGKFVKSNGIFVGEKEQLEQLIKNVTDKEINVNKSDEYSKLTANLLGFVGKEKPSLLLNAVELWKNRTIEAKSASDEKIDGLVSEMQEMYNNISEKEQQPLDIKLKRNKPVNTGKGM